MIPLAIFLIPFLEIWVAVAAVGRFGFMNCFFWWLISLILGLGILRTAGLRVSVGVAQAVRRGEVPAAAAIDGALIAIAGALLLLPGFISDGIGLFLLLPPFRILVRRWLVLRGSKAVFSVFAGQRPRPKSSSAEHNSFEDAAHTVIDVEAVDVSAPGYKRD